jgi:hypothetical protein
VKSIREDIKDMTNLIIVGVVGFFVGLIAGFVTACILFVGTR